MTSRNIIKVYVNNSYYHVYNRGVEKRKIFIDSQDYGVFLNYLKEALLPPPPPPKKLARLAKRLPAVERGAQATQKFLK